MRSGTVRRLAAVGAMVLASGGLVGVTSAPAQARPICDMSKDIFYVEGYGVFATAEEYCPDDNTTTYLPVAIQQQDPVSGAWVQVAYDPNGFVLYSCAGNATRNYRTGTAQVDRKVTAPCS